jgi:hypothetical protein
VVYGLLEWEGGLMGGAWFAWGMGVETKSMVAHDKTNGQWDGRNSRGREMFSAHEKGDII